MTETRRESMGLWPYVLLWLLISGWFGYEYLILNGHAHGPSLLHWLHVKGWLLPEDRLTPEAGGALSYRLGWLGFGLICLTNLYIFRKRLFALRQVGSIPGWLDFHIFCGLLGPTVIVFHTNMKVGGLVAISFWSMMITFTSGIVGRYLYLQLLSDKIDIKERLSFYEKSFSRSRKAVKPPLTRQQIAFLKKKALADAGVTDAVAKGQADLLTSFISAAIGDLRMLGQKPKLPRGVPRAMGKHLQQYALLKRRHYLSGYSKRVMGYWHSFHLPFAIFMYVVTVIHIAAALIFRVHH